MFNLRRFNARKMSAKKSAKWHCSVNHVGDRTKSAGTTQRYVRLCKEADSKFGADLCTIDGRIFVLGVDEAPRKGDAWQYSPAFRAGLTRFDEITQIEHDDVSDMDISEIYEYLFTRDSVHLTILDGPLAETHTIAGRSTIAALLAELEWCDDDYAAPVGSICSALPAGHSVVEIEGELVLGLDAQEMRAMVEYLCEKKGCDAVSVTTMPNDFAAAFLSAFNAAYSLGGSKDWTASALLQRSMRSKSSMAQRFFPRLVATLA